MNQNRRSYPFVRVSDHALLRFVERAGGLDVQALRTALEGSLNRASNQAARINAGTFDIVADGLRYVVVKNVVVTIIAVPTKGTPKAR
ncbi:hypothetical protein X566_15435 [Afipia sp. P52-10]|uniref:hypothetical protein n=1 Tax=Afipia sp. P52-10 TaxID=1429916 RepID=UPI0003DF37A5|nr:hypothetical protein [Afipia sp. P52-10]ETR78885.1 hypothetical protein X566_15435 [Afipia sp. P52-10]